MGLKRVNVIKQKIKKGRNRISCVPVLGQQFLERPAGGDRLRGRCEPSGILSRAAVKGRGNSWSVAVKHGNRPQLALLLPLFLLTLIFTILLHHLITFAGGTIILERSLITVCISFANIIIFAQRSPPNLLHQSTQEELWDNHRNCSVA